MKIAITGHTRGIGNAIYKYFETEHQVIGFSRYNNYNISQDADRKRILEESNDCDIFVNNAFNDYDNSQTLMLKEIFNLWHSQKDKLIINISSRWTKDKNNYCLNKKDQDLFYEQNIFSYPKIINLKPGLINTERVLTQQGKKQETKTLIEILDFILKTKNTYAITSITFGF